MLLFLSNHSFRARHLQIPDEILQAVSQIEIRSRRNVSHLLVGNYRSAFRGSGMQFKEFRPYEPGDDIRHMSWQVTARTGRPTLKTYEEERELNVILVVDVSGSSLFGSRGKRKIDVYAELVALLGLATIQSGDKMGFLPFHNTPLNFLPPRGSRKQVLHAITTLLAQPLKGARSDLNPALRSLRSTLKTRSLLIILSDFLMPDFELEIRAAVRRHEVILLHVFDDGERGQLDRGIFEVWDPETGNYYLLDSNSTSVRNAFATFHMQVSHKLELLSQNLHMDYLPLSLEDDYLQRLVHFFERRGPSRL